MINCNVYERIFKGLDEDGDEKLSPSELQRCVGTIGHSITTNYYVLRVVACQLVLGVQWLKILGFIETNYKELTMTFKVGGDFHTFQGLRHPKIGRAFG